MWIVYAFFTLEVKMSCYKIRPAKTLRKEIDQTLNSQKTSLISLSRVTYVASFVGILDNTDHVITGLHSMKYCKITIQIYSVLTSLSIIPRLLIPGQQFGLTHCGLVTPNGNINLGQHWPKYWLDAVWCLMLDSTKPLPEPMLIYHQYSDIILMTISQEVRTSVINQ